MYRYLIITLIYFCIVFIGKLAEEYKPLRYEGEPSLERKEIILYLSYDTM